MSLPLAVKKAAAEAPAKPGYVNVNHPLGGKCYVASEAYYHLWGKFNGCKPMQMKHEGISHWFLLNKLGQVIDLTVDQFETVPDYSQAKPRAFLTKKPSKRGLQVMNNALDLYGEKGTKILLSKVKARMENA